MVRRGGRSTAPLSTSKNSSTSSSNGSSGTRWSRSRPNSANSGEMIFTIKECTKSFDSSRSSPNASSQSVSAEINFHSMLGKFQMSPPAGKKGNDRGGKGRSSSNWRSRGSGNNRGAVGAAASDSKFSITNEDFPALPGARGGSQSTPNKGARKDRDSSGKLGLTSSTVSHTSENHNNQTLQTEMCVTDDSGVSSSSRGHTPVQDKISPPAISTAIVKGIISDMRKVCVPRVYPLSLLSEASAAPKREHEATGDSSGQRASNTQWPKNYSSGHATTVFVGFTEEGKESGGRARVHRSIVVSLFLYSSLSSALKLSFSNKKRVQKLIIRRFPILVIQQLFLSPHVA